MVSQDQKRSHSKSLIKSDMFAAHYWLTWWKSSEPIYFCIEYLISLQMRTYQSIAQCGGNRLKILAITIVYTRRSDCRSAHTTCDNRKVTFENCVFEARNSPSSAFYNSNIFCNKNYLTVIQWNIIRFLIIYKIMLPSFSNLI